MADVVLSSAVRNNLLSLQNTAAMMDQTQNRLATGQKVNSALDDPTAFFTASSLNARASDLSRLLDSVGLAVQTLSAADEAMSSITKLVESAQATARQARQAAGPTSQQVATAAGDQAFNADQAATATSSAFELATVVEGTEDIAGETDFVGNTTIADGDTLTINGTVIEFGAANDANTAQELLDAVNAIAGVSAEYNNDGELVITAEDGSVVEIEFSVAAVGTELGLSEGEFSNLLGVGNIEQDHILEIDVGGTVHTFTIGTDPGEYATLQDLVAAIDAEDELSAELNEDGEIVVTAANGFDTLEFGEDAADFGFDDQDPYEPVNLLTQGVTDGDTLTIQIGDGAVNTITFGTDEGEVHTREGLVAALEQMGLEAEFNDDDELVIRSVSEDDLIVGGDAADDLGLEAGTIEAAGETIPSTTRDNLESDFNAMLVQINQLAQDATYNGINLLMGDDLTVTFNEDGTSSLTVGGVTFNAAGLGIEEAEAGSFQTNAAIDDALAQLDAAVGSLRAQASSFGSNMSVVETRENFTKSMINTLEAGAGHLTIADTNEESANMLALQTRQQLSTVSLSLAAQAEQSVLRLF